MDLQYCRDTLAQALQYQKNSSRPACTADIPNTKTNTHIQKPKLINALKQHVPEHSAYTITVYDGPQVQEVIERKTLNQTETAQPLSLASYTKLQQQSNSQNRTAKCATVPSNACISYPNKNGRWHPTIIFCSNPNVCNQSTSTSFLYFSEQTMQLQSSSWGFKAKGATAPLCADVRFTDKQGI